ncbi:unnamed protein product, partial [Ectocarpus sp. 13 AM-2016]
MDRHLHSPMATLPAMLALLKNPASHVAESHLCYTTLFCINQEEIDRRVRGSMRMGHSLYGLDEGRLKAADPTVVFTQALCDVCAPSFPMFLSTCARVLGDNPRIVSIEPGSVAEVIDSVRLVGRETGFTEEGIAEARRLEAGFDKIRSVVAKLESTLDTAAPPAAALGSPGTAAGVEGVAPGGASSVPKKQKVAFLEWLEPLFNGGHWVPDLVRAAGGEYTMAEPGNKSMGMSAKELMDYDADIILVAPCGMNRNRAKSDGEQMWRHEWWRELRAVKDGKVCRRLHRIPHTPDRLSKLDYSTEMAVPKIMALDRKCRRELSENVIICMLHVVEQCCRTLEIRPGVC